MAEINFNGNFNNNINNFGMNKKNSDIKNETKASTISDFNPTFANSLTEDTLELSSKKDEDTLVVNYAKSTQKGNKKGGKTFTQINKEEWDRRGGAHNYNGKGADEMGFSVFVSSAVRWAWNKMFG